MKELEVLSFVDILNKLLISQYDQPNFQSLLRIIGSIFNDIQITNFQLRDKFWLADATGEQLEFIGRLWDEDKNADTDDDYRNRIYKKIAQSSSGTIPDIKSYLFARGATYAVYSPEYPAKYRMRTDAAVDLEEFNLLAPAGVGGGYLAGNILDAVGNFLVDANGNNIIHVDGN